MESVFILILGMVLGVFGRLASVYFFNLLLNLSLMTENIKKEAKTLARTKAYNEKRFNRNAARRIKDEGGFVHTIGDEEVSEDTWRKYVDTWKKKKNEQAELTARHNLNVSRINNYRHVLVPGTENPLKLYYETILEQARENVDKYQEEIPAATIATFPQDVEDT